VTLVVGVAVLIGVTTGLLVFQPIGADWIEAAGTWVVGLVGALALVVLAFWSDESERRRERERLQQETNRERERLQLEANNVFCDVRPAVSRAADDPRMVLVDQVEVEVANYSSRVITDTVCRVPLGVFDWSLALLEPLRPGETPVRKTSAEMSPPVRVRKDNRDLRGSVEFTFSLDGVAWSKRYGQAAQRLPESDA
jgi:hypothetical protein